MNRWTWGVVGVLLSVVGISGAFAAEPDVPPVRVVYFYTTDSEPQPDYQARIDRTMRCVQDFYRRGMAENGFGETTFALERVADEAEAPVEKTLEDAAAENAGVKNAGDLVIHLVPASRPRSEYGRDSAWDVYNEAKAYLAEHEGIDLDRDVVVLFQTLLEWDDSHRTATEIGPYCGWGATTRGVAWVYDDALLDAEKLSSKEPGGYYHGACSVGKFNSHYVGGIAHELGHALSLPHDCERADQRERGTSLMGSGNHTFGTDLRGEGRGSFLSAASAARLLRVRAFGGQRDDFDAATRLNVEALSVRTPDEGGRRILVDATVTGEPRIERVVLYHDNADIASDYDAVTWVTEVGDDGRVSFVIDDFSKAGGSDTGWPPSRWELRLTACYENGATRTARYAYTIGENGPDLDSFRESRRGGR